MRLSLTPGWALMLLKGQRIIMAALDDIKAGEAAIDKGIVDVAAALKALADQVSGFKDGVSAADAEQVASDLTAKAAQLEALAAPPAPAV